MTTTTAVVTGAGRGIGRAIARRLADAGHLVVITDLDSEAGGGILNIASISALGPVPGLALYAATKAAVLSYTTSLQGDLPLPESRQVFRVVPRWRGALAGRPAPGADLTLHPRLRGR